MIIPNMVGHEPEPELVSTLHALTYFIVTTAQERDSYIVCLYQAETKAQGQLNHKQLR